MVNSQTILTSVDNSGILQAKCLRVLGYSNNKSGTLGDIVVLSIFKKLNFKQFTAKIFYGIIVGTKVNFRCYSGTYYKCSNNNIIIFQGRSFESILGNRLKGPILSNLGQFKAFKTSFFTRYLI